LGYYGSDTAAPAGYHPHCSYAYLTNALGFVADPNFTGWDTSTATAISHYMGDYFVPGSPFEGWELQVDTMRVQAFNYAAPGVPGYKGVGGAFNIAAGMPPCTGSNVFYASSGSIVQGIWQGMADSIAVKQVTTLDTNNLYFTVNVTLTNTAVAPKNNLYYVRTLDPDNDASWPGGSHKTSNIIEHQMPADPLHISLVSATGTSTPTSYMALGTTDTASRAFYYYCWPFDTTVELSQVFAETWACGNYTPGVTVTDDYAIGLIISIPHLATVDSAGDSVTRTTSAGLLHPANSARFSYFYAFNHAAVDSAIAQTIPTNPLLISPAANASQSADIMIKPNPASTFITVTAADMISSILISDPMGRIKYNNVYNNRQVQVDVKDLPPGVYLIRINGSEVRRFVKQ
jgi:hypothetical protein